MGARPDSTFEMCVVPEAPTNNLRISLVKSGIPANVRRTIPYFRRYLISITTMYQGLDDLRKTGMSLSECVGRGIMQFSFISIGWKFVAQSPKSMRRPWRNGARFAVSFP